MYKQDVYVHVIQHFNHNVRMSCSLSVPTIDKMPELHKSLINSRQAVVVYIIKWVDGNIEIELAGH